MVLLRDDGVLIGEAAERRSLTEPARFAREFKRRIGDPTPVLLGGSPFSAHALMAHLLRGVVKVVADREGGPPDHTVVTCPANWGDYKRELLDQAVGQADIGPVSVVTEPEAAAVHYASTDAGPARRDRRRLRPRRRHVRRRRAAQHRRQGSSWSATPGASSSSAASTSTRPCSPGSSATWPALSRLDPDDPSTVAAVSRLRRDCVEAKENLSWDTDTAIPVVLPDLRTEIRLTRGEFENMIRPALDDTVDAMRRALASAGVHDRRAAGRCCWSGGSSRIPLVGQMLMSALGRPVAIDVHPKHAVALGAALLSGRESPTLATPVDSAVATLVPPAVTRAGRTTVTSPTGTEGPGAPPPPPPLAPPRPTGPPGGPAAAPEAPGRSRWPRGEGGGGGGGGGGCSRAPGWPPAAWSRAVVVLGGGGDDDGTAGTDTSTTRARRWRRPGASCRWRCPGASRSTRTPSSTPSSTPRSGTSGRSTPTAPSRGPSPASEARSPAAGDRSRPPVGGVFARVPAALELRVIDTGGEGDRLVIGDLVPDARATWSPDGSRMAVVTDRDGSADITIVELATGEVTNLTNSPEDEGDPSWSPDGESIAYWSRKDGNQDIYVIPVDGGAPRRLTSDPGDDADPSWKPDGSAIAYSSQREGDWEIFVMGPDGGTRSSSPTSPPTTRTRRGRRTARRSPSRPSGTPRRPATRPRSTSWPRTGPGSATSPTGRVSTSTRRGGPRPLA